MATDKQIEDVNAAEYSGPADEGACDEPRGDVGARTPAEPPSLLAACEEGEPETVEVQPEAMPADGDIGHPSEPKSTAPDEQLDVRSGPQAEDVEAVEPAAEWGVWAEPVPSYAAAAATTAANTSSEIGSEAEHELLADAPVVTATPPDAGPNWERAEVSRDQGYTEILAETLASEPPEATVEVPVEDITAPGRTEEPSVTGSASQLTPHAAPDLVERIERAAEAHYGVTGQSGVDAQDSREDAASGSVPLPHQGLEASPANGEADWVATPADFAPQPETTAGVVLEQRPAAPSSGAPEVETASPTAPEQAVAETDEEPAQARASVPELERDATETSLSPETAPAFPPAPPVTRDFRNTARRIARGAAYAIGAYLALVVVLIGVYRFVDPPASNLMLYESVFGEKGVDQRWVPIHEISPHLIRAVLVSEDGRFCEHHGIDLAAMKEAITRANSAYPRGASTISMQVTKNMFLWQSKSYVRKVFELPLTLMMELVWPKTRILEVYLNIAEWGPGVFGAEAAARHHFNRPAASLGEREAAQLAAALPNPIRRDAGDPGPRLLRKASIIRGRARASPEVSSCIATKRGGPAEAQSRKNKG